MPSFTSLTIKLAGFQKRGSSFSVMAPKSFISENVSAKLVSARPFTRLPIETNELYIFISSELIPRRLLKKIHLLPGMSEIIDISKFHKENNNSESPCLYYVTAHGGNSPIISYTILSKNDTNSIAMEHSLSPHYYLSYNLNNARLNAGYE